MRDVLSVIKYISRPGDVDYWHRTAAKGLGSIIQQMLGLEYSSHDILNGRRRSGDLLFVVKV